MPVPSEIQITVGGTDITNLVLFRTARFEAQAGGGVGTFSFTVKDTAQTQSFTTGDEVVLTLDGTRYFGGYLMQIGRTFAFPVVDTSDVDAVTARQFALSGTNYNVLFDRLVAHDDTDPLHGFPLSSGTTNAGTLATQMANDYIDVPAGFDVSSYVDAVGDVLPPEHIAAGGEFAWVRGGEQGAKWREELAWLSLYNGAIYYLDAEKNLHYHSPESVFSRWGFSDRPNNRSVAGAAPTFTGATYGFRELNSAEDITNMANDAFVWGGSPFIASTDPGAGGTVFARETNDASVTEHGAWQVAEVRFGELGDQGEVDALAASIVRDEGSTGTGTDAVLRNRSLPDWTVSLVWFAHDVPTTTGFSPHKDHLKPGDIVTIILYVHGTDINHPLILTLPLRRVTISFPTLPADPDGEETYARFEGDFGLSLNDPFTLWEAILNRRLDTVRIVASAGSPDATGGPGGLWQGAPDEAPDGSRTLFQLSSSATPIVYVAGSSEIFINGLQMRQGADYQEYPETGEILIFVAPPTGSSILASVRLV